jgi:NAD(P)-dependent dehydrogenase (short-subunit alcohol dehydrogenase family)
VKKLEQLINMNKRRVLITGASGALGSVIAETLAELGASLILVDKKDSDLIKLEKKLYSFKNIDILPLSCDLENEIERNNLINKVKQDNQGLNCLINNAAFVGNSDLTGWVTPFEEQNLDTWRRAIEVNLTAIFHLSQAFTNDLKKAKGGNIINIASIYGEFGPDWSLYEGTDMGNPAAYAASKGGLIQLTRWLANTVAPDVRVNAISPGGIFRDQPKSFIKRYQKKISLQRMANEDDFRGAITFLASDMSAYVTGQILRVDGGWGV